MLPQPIFLNKLIEFLSDENLDLKSIKKGIDKIFSRKDFIVLTELNIKIMGVAKLVLETKDTISIFLPKSENNKIRYLFEELEFDKEIEFNLHNLKDCENAKLIEIIKNEYQKNIVKELDIKTLKEKIKILFIINEVPKPLKLFYKEYKFKEYGLANYLEFDEIWDYYENDIRYFAVLTPMGADKVKLYLQKMKNGEDKNKLNVLKVELDKEK